LLLSGGALGTPSSGTLTNATGLPISTGVAGLASGVLSFLQAPTSANLAAAVTDETGSGSLVFKSEFANQGGLLLRRVILSTPQTVAFGAAAIRPFGTFNLEANKTYKFEVYLPVTAANSGRAAHSLEGVTNNSYKSYQSTHNISAECAATNTSNLASFGLQAATSTVVSKVTGIIRTTGAGTFWHNFACDQGNPSGTATVRAGAYFEIYEIA
jgi:hypothetical protein